MIVGVRIGDYNCPCLAVILTLTSVWMIFNMDAFSELDESRVEMRLVLEETPPWKSFKGWKDLRLTVVRPFFIFGFLSCLERNEIFL